MSEDLLAQQVTGTAQAYLGALIVELYAREGVIELRFRASNYHSGEEVARRLFVRVAGPDDSGEIIDRRFPLVDPPDPF